MKNLKLGDLVTQHGKRPSRFVGQRHGIHVVTLIDNDCFFVDNQHYKIDRCDPKDWMKVSSLEEIKK